MRAAVLDERGLAVREWPDPEPGPGEALVALTRVGICGSDAHFVVDGTARPAHLPIVLGHEPAGRVAGLGPGTDGPAVGTRVAIIPLVVCGVCDRCLAGRTVSCPTRACLGAERDGCWAEFVTVPARNLVELAPGLSDEVAAVATDAVANAHHAVVVRGGLQPDMTVAIWGAGGLGTAAVAISRHFGAGEIVVVDPREAARQRAILAGADFAVAPDEAREFIRAKGGVDLALEFVGRQSSAADAVRALRDGGRAVIVGLGEGLVPAGSMMSLVLREREIRGSYGSEPEEVREVLRLLAEGKLEIPGLVGDTIGLEDVLAGVQRVAAGEADGRLVVRIS